MCATLSPGAAANASPERGLFRDAARTAEMSLRDERSSPAPLIYNDRAMHKALAVFAIAIIGLTACNKKPSSSASASSADPVQQKLEQLAGNGATDCGRLKSMEPSDMKKASDCALQASQKKQPFYVAYDLPGMTIGLAGNSEGKDFAVQSQQPENAEPGAKAEVQSEPCPSEVRVAQSGRVTCFAPGSFGMNSGGGASPHGGMTMPPATGQNPHGGMMTMPPGGMASPHGKPATTQEPANPSKTKQ